MIEEIFFYYYIDLILVEIIFSNFMGINKLVVIIMTVALDAVDLQLSPSIFWQNRSVFVLP